MRESEPRHREGPSEKEETFASLEDTLLREYRRQLFRRLVALQSVVQIALSKVEALLDQKKGDGKRLAAVSRNLTQSLEMCIKARLLMEKKMIEERKALPGSGPVKALECPSGEGGRHDSKMSFREYVEFTSLEEYRKFREQPPLTDDEVRLCDLDALIRKLMDS